MLPAIFKSAALFISLPMICILYQLLQTTRATNIRQTPGISSYKAGGE
jgi:hypothetical protein